jgi:hypothetical protein
MTNRNPFVWALCALMIVTFGYCLFIGAMSQ